MKSSVESSMSNDCTYCNELFIWHKNASNRYDVLPAFKNRFRNCCKKYKIYDTQTDNNVPKCLNNIAHKGDNTDLTVKKYAYTYSSPGTYFSKSRVYKYDDFDPYIDRWYDKYMLRKYLPSVIRYYELYSDIEICHHSDNVYKLEAYNDKTYVDGFNRRGQSYDRFYKNKKDIKGYNCKGYNKYGYNRSGYNKNNRSLISYDMYNSDGYDKHGYYYDGYDKHGFNNKGYDKKGNKRINKVLKNDLYIDI